MHTYVNTLLSRIARSGFFFHAIFSFLILMLGFATISFSQAPRVTFQLANGAYNCTTQQYCVDAEFLSPDESISVFAMNIRFFYDDNVLEFANFSDFQGGYAAMTPNPPYISTSGSAGPAMFNFAGPAEFVNGAMQLENPSAPTILLNPETGTKLFKICFTVDDPNVDEQSFCPSIVLDLEANPENGGYLGGSEGIVITVEDPGPYDSQPATESVVQYNWMYTGNGTAPYGVPVEDVCVAYGSLTSDIILPLSVTCRTSNNVIKSVVSGGCGALTYAWTVQGGGASIRSGQGTPQITIYMGIAPATIVLIVTDAAGNMSASTDTLRCTSRREVVVNTHAVPADMEFDTNFMPVQEYAISSRSDDIFQNFNLWPNPARESINLSWTSAFDDEVQVRLTNIAGQVVLTHRIKVSQGNNHYTIDVSNLAEGSYLMDMQSSLESQTKNIIILR